MTRLIFVGGAVLLIALTPRVAAAQAAATGTGRFLALDVFAGGIPHPDDDPERDPSDFVPMGGWDAGASVRTVPEARWLEWVGTYGSHSNESVRVRNVTGGIRTTSPWLEGRGWMVRGFTHALAGYAWARPLTGVRDSGPELALGAGFDAFFIRLQVDYVRGTLDSVPRNSPRAFIGGVLPLCLSGCREWEDGIELGARRHRRQAAR